MIFDVVAPCSSRSIVIIVILTIDITTVIIRSEPVASPTTH